MGTKILLSKDKKQYKANLHCHSTISDGKLTPEELKKLYKENGYDILAITDHCVPKNHSDLTEEDFLLLTGYEAYIRPGENGKYNSFKSEIHLNLFAREADNEKLINYNQGYTKYLPVERHGELHRVGSERPREYTTEYINEFIETAIEHGYLVSYNHPVWSMESEARILSYEKCFSLEMYNTSSRVVNGMEDGQPLYDLMLRKGKRMGCHAGDDNHNRDPFDSPTNDSCGSHTMILADKLDYASVIHAMEEKDFYASNGPRIHEITVTDASTVHVECSPASKVFVFFGSKAPKLAYAGKGEALTSLDFELHPKAKYIRVSVYDEAGNAACSRGYFRDEWAEV